jgi:hypothetical protein
MARAPWSWASSTIRRTIEAIAVALGLPFEFFALTVPLDEMTKPTTY